MTSPTTSTATLSLRSRLVAGMVFIAVVLLVVSVVVTVSTRNRLMDQVDQRLSSFSPSNRFGGPPQNPPVDLDELRTPVGGEDVPLGGFRTRVSDVYQGVIDPDGELITIFTPNLSDDEYAPPQLDEATITGDLPATVTVGATGGDVTYRVLLQPFGDVIGVTGVPIDDVQDTIARLIWVEVLGSLAILAALGIVGWWVVHLGIRPVKEMTTIATEIAGGDLSVRVPEPRQGTEAGDLATALNTMLGQIEGALDERRASEERLRRFVSDASHELRTPVTSIRGYAELYRHGALDEPAALADAMRRTEQEATRISRLVDEMLALARYDERRPFNTSPVDIAQIANDAALDGRATAPSRSITTTSPDHPVIVMGDEDRLRQVIANVVTNALVHTPDDVPITIDVTDADGEVVVKISDTGPGMEPEVAARVTERFYRADASRSRQRGGSGLGMAIVDAAVSAHGGTITINSAPGKGTTVRLAFPSAGPFPTGSAPSGVCAPD